MPASETRPGAERRRELLARAAVERRKASALCKGRVRRKAGPLCAFRRSAPLVRGASSEGRRSRRLKEYGGIALANQKLRDGGDIIGLHRFFGARLLIDEQDAHARSRYGIKASKSCGAVR